MRGEIKLIALKSEQHSDPYQVAQNMNGGWCRGTFLGTPYPPYGDINAYGFDVCYYVMSIYKIVKMSSGIFVKFC